MHTADKTGAEIGLERGAKTSSSLSSRPVCPCLNVTAIHLGGCFFAATMLGAAVYGVWGALVGACLGLLIGAFAAFSKNR